MAATTCHRDRSLKPQFADTPEWTHWYHAGPHVMFVFPEGTGRILKGLGHDATSGLPYVRPFPGAEPLLVVPIAKPGEKPGESLPK
jgi:hypothetical protein